MHQASTRGARRRHRSAVLALSSALAVALPGLAAGSAVTANHLRTDVAGNPARVGFYDYTTGTARTWTSQADFAAGTLTAARADLVPGAVTLDPVGPPGTALPDLTIPWWDKDWATRHCVTVDHTAPGAAAVGEYQVAVTLDLAGLVGAGLLQADAGDLRAVAADGVTQLDLWVEGPLDSGAGVVWVQVDAIPAGAATHFCLYHGHQPGPVGPLPNHTAAAVFTHSIRKPIYYAVSGRHATNPAPVAVVSFVAGNEVARDAGPPVALAAAGDRATFPAAGTLPASVFSVLGPISGQATANGYDALAPISWAATSFAVPTTRATQRFSFYAPFADATVSIYNGGAAAPYATFVVPAGTQYTHPAGDVTGGNAAIVAATAPVLLTHVATNGLDAVVVPPASGAPAYGVRTRNVRTGFTADGTTLTVRRSDGTSQAYAHDRGDTRAVGGGSAQGGGGGDGFEVTADGPIGSLQQADGDGNESTMFVPGAELGSEYWLPADSQYVAVVCPAAGAGFPVTITPPAGPARSLTCVGPGAAQPAFPGWGRDTANLAVTAGRGIRVHSPGGEPFAAIYEHRPLNDETMLLGMKQGRQLTWPEPVLSVAVEGLAGGPGTWESATLDTGAGGVYGEIDWRATLPPGASVRFQVATGPVDPPGGFVGPDGTAATFFATLPAALAFAHDADRYLRVRAYLATADPCRSPELEAVTVDHDLAELAHPLGGAGPIAVAGTVGGTGRHYLVRATTADPGLAASLAHLRLRSGAGLGNVVAATLELEDPARAFAGVQLSLAGGPPAPPTGPLEAWGPAAPHSIVLVEEMLPGGATIELRWRMLPGGLASPFTDRDVSLGIAS